MICAACGKPIEDRDRHEAICWLDPEGVAVVAHGPCLDPYEEIMAGFAAGDA